jgi:CxxC motif-containing protein (DUF1111 family)
MKRVPASVLFSLSIPLTLLACSEADTTQTKAPEVVQTAAPAAAAPSVEVAVRPEATTVSLAATEAPTAFDNLTNGFVPQADFDSAMAGFRTQEDIADGLGPVYNAQSCGECHQNPVTGAASQIGEFRAGHFDGTNFIDHPGGSLIDDRATDASLQERIAAGQEVRTFRIATSILGDGFVEAIDNATIQAIAAAQPASMRGQVIQVPVGEGPAGTVRVGRFGWKNQHASLVSFAADAYLNEMGITSRLEPRENTSNGRSVAAFDPKPDPEDVGGVFGADLDEFIEFMRATKAPPRDAALAATPSAIRGSSLFDSIGCATCHMRNITTAPAGTVINGGTYTVPAALGDKIIHPFSDFLLHNVGTGDGIVQNGGQSTRNKLRTPPLWGLRVRDRLMHDGATVSRTDAIMRHTNEADGVVLNFIFLSAAQQQDVINFLNTL